MIHTPFTKSSQIEEVTAPNIVKDHLKELSQYLNKSLKENPEQFHEKGYATIKELPIHLRMPGFFVGWIADINEIVATLNLVLNDIKLLAEKSWLLEGSTAKRFHLLFSVYFYEFYRFREIFNEAIAALRKASYLTREDCNLVHKAFNDAFEETIKMRNQLTHARINWLGDRVDLVITDFRRELGYMVVDIDTGNEVTVDTFLQKLCPKYYNAFYAEGQRICKVYQAVINNMTGRFIGKDNIRLKKDIGVSGSDQIKHLSS